jgi:hypothetical protein
MCDTKEDDDKFTIEYQCPSKVTVPAFEMTPWFNVTNKNYANYSAQQYFADLTEKGGFDFKSDYGLSFDDVFSFEKNTSFVDVYGNNTELYSHVTRDIGFGPYDTWLILATNGSYQFDFDPFKKGHIIPTSDNDLMHSFFMEVNDTYIMREERGNIRDWWDRGTLGGKKIDRLNYQNWLVFGYSGTHNITSSNQTANDQQSLSGQTKPKTLQDYISHSFSLTTAGSGDFSWEEGVQERHLISVAFNSLNVTVYNATLPNMKYYFSKRKRNKL